MIGSLVFLFPLLIWYRYSEQIASDGGLYAFVEAAVGARIARVQATFWVVSYFLYLVYTVPYIAYYLLPVFSGQAGHNPLLIDGVLALVFFVLMLSPLVAVLWAMAASVVIQLLLVIALIAVSLGHMRTPFSAFIGHGNLPAILGAAGKISPLYICASLPLFLGGEVRSGTVAVRRALSGAFPVVAVLAILAIATLSSAAPAVLNTDVPGVALAGLYVGPGFAGIVGVGVAISVGGLIIAEFLALTRLLATTFNRPLRGVVALTAGAFLLASLLGLIDPASTYRLLLKPSLIALWISQLMVVAAYPWFVARHRRLVVTDFLLTVGASLLMVGSLYGAATSATAT